MVSPGLPHFRRGKRGSYRFSRERVERYLAEEAGNLSDPSADELSAFIQQHAGG